LVGLWSRCAELKCTCRVMDTVPRITRGAAGFREADFFGMEGQE
jgi:hypothetical protein